MALHGEVKINGTTLYQWQARRLTPLTSQQSTHRYEVQVITEVGMIRRTVLRHKYSEGALVLTRKVLGWAAREGL